MECRRDYMVQLVRLQSRRKSGCLVTLVYPNQFTPANADETTACRGFEPRLPHGAVAQTVEQLPHGAFRQPCRRDHMYKEITPGEGRHGYRSERRGNPEVAGFETRRASGAQDCPARPCRRTRPEHRGECRRDYSTTKTRSGGQQTRHADPASGQIAQSLPPCRPGPVGG